MGCPGILISLGASGDESLAVFLEFAVPFARERHTQVAENQKVIYVRRPDAEERHSRSEFDRHDHGLRAICHRLMSQYPESELFTELPESEGDEATDSLDSAEPPELAKAWDGELRRAISLLQRDLEGKGGTSHQTMYAYVVANLCDADQAKHAREMGLFLQEFRSQDIHPTLFAVLAPREKDFIRADSLRAHAATRLKQIMSESEEYGYADVIVIDGHLVHDSVIQLKDNQVAGVIGQLLHALTISEVVRAGILGDSRVRKPMHEGEPVLTTANAASYRYDSGVLANYAALRLFLRATTDECLTDAGLGSRLADAEWPLEDGQADSTEELILRHGRQLASRLRDVIGSDVAEIVEILNRVTANAGYEEMLGRKAFFETADLETWPEICRELVGVIERGVIEPVKGVLLAAVGDRVGSLQDALIDEVGQALQRPNQEIRLLGGTATLATFRLLNRELNKSSNTDFKQLEDATAVVESGNQSHQLAAARLFAQLQDEAKPTPMPPALAFRSALSAFVITSFFLVLPGSVTTGLVPKTVEALAAGAAGGLLCFGLGWGWLVWLRRRSCERILNRLLDEFRLRYRAILHQLRCAALNEYRREVRRSIHQAASVGKDTDSSKGGLQSLFHVLAECSAHWEVAIDEMKSLRKECERSHHNSACIKYVPRLPDGFDEPSERLFTEELDTVIRKLAIISENEKIKDTDALSAVRACLVENKGFWSELTGENIANYSDGIGSHLRDVIQSVQRTMLESHYGQATVNSQLRAIPSDHVKSSQSAKQPNVKAALEGLNSEAAEKAKQGVLAEDLIRQAEPALPIGGLLKTVQHFWISGAEGRNDDYLLRSFGQLTLDKVEFSGDKASAILVSVAEKIPMRVALDGQGSIYKQLCDKQAPT